MTSVRLDISQSDRDGATVTVRDPDMNAGTVSVPGKLLYQVTVRVCDDHEAMRRALNDVARFLVFYVRPE